VKQALKSQLSGQGIGLLPARFATSRSSLFVGVAAALVVLIERFDLWLNEKRGFIASDGGSA
jgi:hypothetical protein